MHPMRVFVSHSSDDKQFAGALVAALRGAGADVWLDDSHLGTGQILDKITRQLAHRLVFVVVLSKAAFASEWVRRECKWAYNLYGRDPSRLILPVVASPLDPDDFNAMLYLEDFRRVEGPRHTPYPHDEAIAQTLQLLQLALPSRAPSPAAPLSETAADLLTRGKALSALGREEEALPLFARATQLTPESDTAWLSYADTLIALGREEEAGAAFSEWLQAEHTTAESWVLVADLLQSDSQFDEALDAYDRALDLDPTSVEALLRKIALLVALGWHAEAAEFLAKLSPTARAALRDVLTRREERALYESQSEIAALFASPEGEALLMQVSAG